MQVLGLSNFYNFTPHSPEIKLQQNALLDIHCVHEITITLDNVR